MKKMISISMCLLMLCSVLCLGACGGGKGDSAAFSVTPGEAESVTGAPADVTTQPFTMEPADNYMGGTERFTLTSDQTTVAPGGSFTVTLHAENGKNVACFDVMLSVSGNCQISSAKEKDRGDFITTVSEEEKGVHYSAIVATTSSFDALDLLTVTYTVPADAAAGDTITVEGVFPQFLVGTDESGDRTADATNLVSIEPLTLTVG
jgi:hypothetical protein